MKFIKQKIYFLIHLLLFIPSISFATTGQTPSGGLTNPLNNIDDVPGLLAEILDIMTQIMLPIIVLAIIYTGFLFVKAQGKPEELKTARNALLWTVIGALIVLGATALSNAIEGTIGELTVSVKIVSAFFA